MKLHIKIGLHLLSEAIIMLSPSLTTRCKHEQLDYYSTILLEINFLWSFPPPELKGKALPVFVTAGRARFQLALWSQIMLGGGGHGSLSCCRHFAAGCQFNGWNQMVSMPDDVRGTQHTRSKYLTFELHWIRPADRYPKVQIPVLLRRIRAIVGLLRKTKDLFQFTFTMRGARYRGGY